VLDVAHQNQCRRITGKNMKTQIPSPVLARLQVMFNSGMTLQEVTEALELEVTEAVQNPPPPQPDQVPELQAEVPDAQPAERVPEPQNPLPDVSSAAAIDALPSEVVDYLFRLVNGVQKLGEQVYGLAGHDKVRNSKSLSKTSQDLIATTQSIAKLVNAVNRYVPSEIVEGSGPKTNLEKWEKPPALPKMSSSPTTAPEQKTGQKVSSSKPKAAKISESRIPRPDREAKGGSRLTVSQAKSKLTSPGPGQQTNPNQK